MKLKSYKHFPLKEAEILQKNTKKIKLRVTTINWTFATETRNKIRKQYYDKVHINIYETTLSKLIDWIRETEEVAENIIKIEVL